MIIGATLLCDRKPAFPVSLEYLTKDPLIEKIYVNVQTTNPLRYHEVIKYLQESGKPYDIDFWNVESSWINNPQYDQDPARFAPIAQGRNMAVDWAIVQSMMFNVSHLLFIDSDVRPYLDGLQYLLDLNKPLCGGLVPGRGAHSHVNYVFGLKEEKDNIIKCEHGTSGYLLIAKSIFEVQRFRAGPCIYKREVFLCDDPAYATDAYFNELADGWYIDRRAKADHVDDPMHPLTLEEAIVNYDNP